MKVVVIGGGVIGCTSALLLAERGYDVILVARDLPSDSQSQSFASPWAGANWHSFPGSSKQIQAWERITYAKLQSLIPLGIVGKLEWIDFWLDDTDSSYIEHAWYNDLIPDHKLMSKSELEREPDGFSSAGEGRPAREQVGRTKKKRRKWLVDIEEAGNLFANGAMRWMRRGLTR